MQDIFTIKLNEEERLLLNQLKKSMHQTRDSSTMKEAMKGYAEVIKTPLVVYHANLVIENDRKNRRMGITKFEK